MTVDQIYSCDQKKKERETQWKDMCLSDGEWSEEGQNSLIQFNDSSCDIQEKDSWGTPCHYVHMSWWIISS